jgi:hypothetical protein
MAGPPKLLKADAQMLRWCASLEEEIAGWPQVTSKAMFGMQAYYRDGRIFAALPRTRAPETPFSFLVKTAARRQGRLRGGRGPGAGWSTFEMTADADLAAALEQLSRAYEQAAPDGAPRE